SSSTFHINLTTYPDLKVEALAVSGPDASGTFTASWNTANRGTAPVAIPFKERLFVKNTRNNSVLLNIERNVTNAIAAGAVLAQSATITATNAGPHQVLVTTDSSGLVYENNASGHNAAELNTFESAFTILADYNITLAANPSQAGSVTGGGKVKEGSSVTVKATPNTAQLPYSFLNWTENGTFQSGASNYTFTATKDRQLVANFVLPNFQVTAANNPSTAGTVTGAGSYAYGATANLNASPAFGYKFTNWTEGATVIGVNPSISLTVTNARSVTANYAEANLVHVVTTESSPSGIATITGAGIYNNGQSVVVTAPASVTNNATIYTFTRFTLNGTAYQTNRSFTESFTTTDPTNMVLVAEYGSRSQFPLVTNIFANYNNPVPATTNLQLTFQFNRAMKTSPEPTIRMSNTISGASAPVVLTGGTWTSTVNTNDTYHTKAIVVSTGMDGTNRVYISAAQDLDGAATRETNAYNLVLDATFPVISNIKVEPGSGAVVVTWNTDEPSSSQVEFGQTTAYGRRTPLSINLVTSHRVLVSGLTPQTGYHFRVLAQDKAGNLRASADGSFTTLPAPDLLISGINFAPGAWQSGSAITVGWTNSNVGVGPTSGSWYDQITISNKTTGKILVQDYVFYDNSRLGDIPSGSVKTAQYNYVLPEGPDGAGQIEVSIITDFYNNLIESNGSNTAESNNSFVQVKSSVIRSYPDLQVQQLAASPGTIQSGTQVTLTWNDANSGQAGASGLIQDRIVVRNNTSGETLVNTVLGYDSTAVGNAPIGAGETLPRSYKFTLPDGSRGAGDLAIEVTTDIGNVVYEYNASNTGENNNKAILALNSTLATYPDLTVTSISAPASATAGQTVQVTWAVQNRGAKAATGPWVDQIFLSTDTAIGGDQYVGAVTFNDAIPANSSVQRTNTITLPSFGTGNRWVVIRTDAANAIYESDEGNNLSIDDQAINLPSNLIFTLSRPSVPESYGANAVRGTITRNSGTENDLTISLTSSDLSEATVPATVTIPAGQTSVSFPIAAVDDSIVDGTQNVVITANAAGMSSVTANLAVTDDDSAVLTISVNPAVVRENGGPNAALGAITRNTANTEALTVSLASSDPAKLTVPTSVIIPAGQNGATFPIGAVDNAFPNRPARITISASVTGYQSVPAIVDVADDDSPTLTLTLDKAVISEGAANPATYATVTRNPVTSRSLNVLIHSDTESAAKVPVSVVIPPDQASVSFPITAINNDQVNFPQEVRIMAYTADYVFETPLDEGAGLAILTVTDDDGPTLKLTVDSELISERSSTTGRVFRNTPTTNALVVTLTSQDTSEASVPANVTIPIGQASATFTISGVVDSLADGIQPANIVASAPGYTSGHAKVNVSDIDLPDLRVTEISIPTNALTGGSANVSWKVKNEGLSTAVAPWIDRVYLSSTPDGANLQYVGQFIRSSDLAVGEFYERSATVLLPTTPGRFYLVVVTDAVNAVTEGGELNNTTVTSGVINIEPAYRANVQADIETTLAGTSIPLHGQAFKTGSGSPAPFALVTVRVNVK
ncbi:MAG: CARDB domain-containing protein, partial [Verrucomicrobiota bacterium]